jgi:hypothetical protein
MDTEEAKSAVIGGADIIDVKNPKEGSLGANFPWVIRSIKEVIGDKTLSAAIGDIDKPGTASLAALGAAISGAEYIKVGLKVGTKGEAMNIMENAIKSVKEFDARKKVVAAGYSDYERMGTFSPFELPDIGREVNADVVMVDTGIKDGKSTFEFLSDEALVELVTRARELGMEMAIAGSIKFEDIDQIKRIDPDILGVRGIVCGGDRNARIKRELVERLRDCI